MSQRTLSMASVACGCLLALWAGSGLGACAKGATTTFGDDDTGGAGGVPTTTSWSTTTTSWSTTTTTTSSATTTTTSYPTTTTSAGCDPIWDFTCGDSSCVLILFVCDGVVDCADGSDEDPAMCGGGGSWSCDPSYYGDGLCDCGCGEMDSDCYDSSVDSCEYCDDPGSCSVDVCPGTIDPNDNSTCQ